MLGWARAGQLDSGMCRVMEVLFRFCLRRLGCKQLWLEIPEMVNNQSDNLLNPAPPQSVRLLGFLLKCCAKQATASPAALCSL